MHEWLSTMREPGAITTRGLSHSTLQVEQMLGHHQAKEPTELSVDRVKPARRAREKFLRRVERSQRSRARRVDLQIPWAKRASTPKRSRRAS